MSTTSAAAVSATLRRGGLQPNNDRKREGLRVQGRQTVSIRADFDSETTAARLGTRAAEILTAAGYELTVVSASIVHVTGKR